MCELCADAARSHAVSISYRPGQRLAGLWWSGGFELAASDAVRSVIVRVRDFSAQRDALWKSPIVGLSKNDRSDRLDYFAGISVDPGETLPADFVHLDIPEMAVASSWHGPDDGDVVAHYGRMVEWLRGSGYRRTNGPFHQREEYPHDVDLAAPPALRLMLPIERDNQG